MTAPSGQSTDRFRIGQPVVATADHQAPSTVSGYERWIVRGDVGYLDYFWNDGRFVVTWKRHPASPVSYGPEAWPSRVGPAPDAPNDDRPIAADAREPAWAEAIARSFGGS